MGKTADHKASVRPRIQAANRSGDGTKSPRRVSSRHQSRTGKTADHKASARPAIQAAVRIGDG